MRVIYYCRQYQEYYYGMIMVLYKQGYIAESDFKLFFFFTALVIDH